MRRRVMGMVVGIALALSGCSTGGNGGTETTTPPTQPVADRETTTNPPTTVAAPPRVWVPSFVFDHVSDARREARRLGIHLRVRRVNDSSWEEGTVLDQSRSGRVKPGATIVVTVARTPPCTEGYDPCLSPASDYDCLGGSGDGPEYTGRVRVTGSDPYDLDRDGDGWGCE